MKEAEGDVHGREERARRGGWDAPSCWPPSAWLSGRSNESQPDPRRQWSLRASLSGPALPTRSSSGTSSGQWRWSDENGSDKGFRSSQAIFVLHLVSRILAARLTRSSWARPAAGRLHHAPVRSGLGSPPG